MSEVKAVPVVWGNTYLKKAGKIRPTESYEILQVNNPGKATVNYSVTFRITEACDLACSYCHWNGGRHYDYNSIITSIDRLFDFFQKQKFQSVVFYYHGGEATRHSRVVDILKHIKDKSTETGVIAYNEMQTNLTIKPEKLKEILPYCDLFNTTFHYLELKKRGYKLDAFDTNFKMLMEMGVEIHNLDIMLENLPADCMEDFRTRIELYTSYEKILNSEMIYGFGYNNEDYNEKTLELHYDFYKKFNKTDQLYKIDGKVYTTNEMFKNGLDCTGWWCGAGTESITINGDGNVYNCGIHMTNFIKQHPETPFTNLVTDPLAVNKMSLLFKTGTRCRWDYCGGDFYLEKHKL